MRRDWLVILLLIVVTAAVFARVSRFEFLHYDDPDYVFENPYVTAGLTQQGVAWAFGALHGRQTYWHPLSWLSHMLDCQLFGAEWSKAGSHHLMNLLFHLLNTLLVFRVCHRMTGALWRSAVVAALFALHPLQVDTVAWITERKNLLSGLFWLLAMLAYVRYAERPTLARYWPILVWLALGLMSKPVLVTFPFALFLLDFWPLRRFPSTGSSTENASGENLVRPVFPAVSWRQLVLEKLPMIPLVLLSIWLTVAGHKGFGVDQAVHGIPLYYRFENALVCYARYLGKVFWPSNLAVLYPHPGQWAGAAVAGSALLLLALTVIAACSWRRAPWLAVGWCWFLGVLVPAMGFMQFGVQAMADRFVYVPIIGLLWMVVWGLAEWFGDRAGKSLCLTLASAAAIAGCVVISSVQLGYWRNSITLFEHTLAVTTNNFVMQNNLAFALNRVGRQDEALRHLEAAIGIKPDYTSAHLQMALILDARGQTAKAVEHYQIAARERPGNPMALNNLAWILATHPKAELRDGAEAVRLAERACALSRRRQPLFIGTLAAAYAEAGRFQEAIAAAQQARDLAKATGARELAATNEQLLELYQAQKPFRQGSPQQPVPSPLRQ